MHALFFGPEGPTVLRPKPDEIPEGFLVVCEVASDRLAILRLILVPPSLANTTAWTLGSICSDAVLVDIARSASFLRLRGRGTLVVHVSPTTGTEHVI